MYPARLRRPRLRLRGRTLRATAALRVGTSSFSRMCSMCLRTVCGETTRTAAISRDVLPSATRPMDVPICSSARDRDVAQPSPTQNATELDGRLQTMRGTLQVTRTPLNGRPSARRTEPAHARVSLYGALPARCPLCAAAGAPPTTRTATSEIRTPIRAAHRSSRRLAARPIRHMAYSWLRQGGRRRPSRGSGTARMRDRPSRRSA
jgi:hypothetical protein